MDCQLIFKDPPVVFGTIIWLRYSNFSKCMSDKNFNFFCIEKMVDSSYLIVNYTA